MIQYVVIWLYFSKASQCNKKWGNNYVTERWLTTSVWKPDLPKR